MTPRIDQAEAQRSLCFCALGWLILGAGAGNRSPDRKHLSE